MGQGDVIDILLACNRPLNRGQIAIRLESEPESVSHILRKLLKNRDIECIEVDRNKAAELLNSKSPLRRMKFYYIGKSKRRFLL